MGEEQGRSQKKNSGGIWRRRREDRGAVGAEGVGAGGVSRPAPARGSGGAL
jgi:hypothetical protein